MFGPAHNSAEQVPKRFIRHGLIVDDLYGEREPEDESVGALAFLGHQWLDACIPKAVEEVQGQSTSVQAWLSEAKCVKRIVVVNGWPGGRKSKEAPLRSRCRSTVMVWSAPGKRIKKSALCDVSPLPIISNQLGFGIQPVILINSSMWKENR